MNLSHYIMLGLGSLTSQATTAPTISSNTTDLLQVHPISRVNNVRFENLAVRSNGQILVTTTMPNASVYQFDPLAILQPTIIYTVPNVSACAGIVEAEPDIFFVACGDVNMTIPITTKPPSYNIWRLDVLGMDVLPDGNLTREPAVKHIANLPGAALLNGIALLPRPHQDHLEVADTFRGLIWDVDVCSGELNVALNTSATRGPGSIPAGVNGIKVFNQTLYWDNTGSNTLWTSPFSEHGTLATDVQASLLASNVSGDDFVVDAQGTVWVANPYNVITRVDPDGHAQTVAGIFNSTLSPLAGPTALAFGRLVSDRWSLYVTSNGGLYAMNTSERGLSRIDLGVGVEASSSGDLAFEYESALLT